MADLPHTFALEDYQLSLTHSQDACAHLIRQQRLSQLAHKRRACENGFIKESARGRVTL